MSYKNVSCNFIYRYILYYMLSGKCGYCIENLHLKSPWTMTSNLHVFYCHTKTNMFLLHPSLRWTAHGSGFKHSSSSKPSPEYQEVTTKKIHP